MSEDVYKFVFMKGLKRGASIGIITLLGGFENFGSDYQIFF